MGMMSIHVYEYTPLHLHVEAKMKMNAVVDSWVTFPLSVEEKCETEKGVDEAPE